MMLTRVGTNVLHWKPYNIVVCYYYYYYYDTVILYYKRRRYRLLADWFSPDELFSSWKRHGECKNYIYKQARKTHTGREGKIIWGFRQPQHHKTTTVSYLGLSRRLNASIIFHFLLLVFVFPSRPYLWWWRGDFCGVFLTNIFKFQYKFRCIELYIRMPL